MAEGFERLKTNTWFKVPRLFLDYALNQLTDAEFKLWMALRGSAYDFEGTNVGQVRVTIDKINGRFGWAQGKSSTTLSGLLKKNFTHRLKRGLYYVCQTLPEVQNSEHFVGQNDEQKVQVNEVKVQQAEPNYLNSQSYKYKKSNEALDIDEIIQQMALKDKEGAL